MLNRRNFLGSAALALGAHGISAGAATQSSVLDGVVHLADGRAIAFRQFGDPSGAPAFYFHGMPGSRLEPGLVGEEALAAGVRLVAVDRPGVGCSSMQSCRRVVDWPADVAQLADALPGFEQFSVVGVSGGAPFALASAIQLPHRVKTVALVSGHTPFGVPGVSPGNQDRQVALVARRPRLAKAFLTLVGRRLQSRPDRALQTLTKPWTNADRQLVLCNPVYRGMFLQNLRQAFRCPAGLTRHRAACSTLGLLRSRRLVAGDDLARLSGRRHTALDGSLFPSGNQRQRTSARYGVQPRNHREVARHGVVDVAHLSASTLARLLNSLEHGCQT